MAIYSEFFHQKLWFSIVMLNYQGVNHGLWEVWLISWGKGLIFRNDWGIVYFFCLGIYGDLLRIVVGRMEKVYFIHMNYNL